jgi:hypothetical protein
MTVDRFFTFPPMRYSDFGDSGNVLTSNGEELGPSFKPAGNPSVSVSLSSAQLVALHTTPIEMIPAPGAGKIILLGTVFVQYTFVSVAYTEGFLGLLYGSDGLGACDNQFIGIGLSTASKTFLSYGYIQYYDPDQIDNQPIYVGGSTNPFIGGGDGTMKITASYSTLTL